MFFFQEGVFFFQSQLGDLDLFFLKGTSKVFTQFIFRHLNLGILQNDCAGKVGSLLRDKFYFIEFGEKAGILSRPSNMYFAVFLGVIRVPEKSKNR